VNISRFKGSDAKRKEKWDEARVMDCVGPYFVYLFGPWRKRAKLEKALRAAIKALEAK